MYLGLFMVRLFFIDAPNTQYIQVQYHRQQTRTRVVNYHKQDENSYSFNFTMRYTWNRGHPASGHVECNMEWRESDQNLSTVICQVHFFILHVHVSNNRKISSLALKYFHMILEQSYTHGYFFSEPLWCYVGHLITCHDFFLVESLSRTAATASTLMPSTDPTEPTQGNATIPTPPISCKY